ncbi:MAG TPA: hypothetical protein DDZ89_02095 [Clostridiales bacterium]|nr:hypothetical protein [Clostridiales bacterium]
MDKKGYLKEFTFIEGMDPKNRNYLMDALIIKRLPKGFVMVGDQGNCKGIPLVTKGNLRLFKISENGREMTVYRVAEGELCVLAAVCVLGGLEYQYSVEAEKDCVIADIPPEAFIYLLEKDNSFKTYVFRTLADKLISSLNTMEMITFKSIEERIIDYLDTHADNQGKIVTTHEKIAIELGSSREVISRQLKKMADEGLLTQKRGSIILNKKPQ